MINEEILLERKLTTDFTFGFELEGCATGKQDLNDPECEVRKFITSHMGTGGDFHSDGSIEVDEGCVEYFKSQYEGDKYYYYGEEYRDYELEEELGDLSKVRFQVPFEYASPVLKFNVENIQKTVNMLADGAKRGKYFSTNESCGFHHHLSFEGITGEDAAWIVSQLAMDEQAQKLFSDFTTYIQDYNQEMTYHFITNWSENVYLNYLKTAIENFDFQDIKKYLNTEKYSILNVHNNHTLEWRGPRDFLNSGNRKVIISFYKHLWKVVSWMTEALDRKEINGMKKDTYLKNLIIDNDFRPIKNFPEFKLDKNGLISDAIMEKILNKINTNPTILIGLAENKRTLDQVIQKLFNNSKLGKTLEALNEKAKIYPQAINDIAYKYVPARMGKLASEDAIYNTSERTLRRLIETRYGVSKQELVDVITYLTPKMNLEVIKSYNEGQYLNKLIYASKYNLLDYLFNELNDEQQKNVALSYIGSLRNNEPDINQEGLSTIMDNIRDDLTKEIISKDLGKMIYKQPSVIKYIDNIDNMVILSLIGRAMRDDNLDSIKNMLLNSGKVSKSQFAEMESYFTKYYEHDLDDELKTI